jgi:hypothetical protein
MNLKDALNLAIERLDPQHQGAGWPDPVAWDGRGLQEIARDLASILDAQGDTESRDLAEVLWQVAQKGGRNDLRG